MATDYIVNEYNFVQCSYDNKLSLKYIGHIVFRGRGSLLIKIHSLWLRGWLDQCRFMRTYLKRVIVSSLSSDDWCLWCTLTIAYSSWSSVVNELLKNTYAASYITIIVIIKKLLLWMMGRCFLNTIFSESDESCSSPQCVLILWHVVLYRLTVMAVRCQSRKTHSLWHTQTHRHTHTHIGRLVRWLNT